MSSSRWAAAAATTKLTRRLLLPTPESPMSRILKLHSCPPPPPPLLPAPGDPIATTSDSLPPSRPSSRGGPNLDRRSRRGGGRLAGARRQTGGMMQRWLAGWLWLSWVTVTTTTHHPGWTWLLAGFIAGSRGAGRAESQSGNWQVNCLARVGWGGSRDGVVGFLGDSAGGLASRSCLVGAGDFASRRVCRVPSHTPVAWRFLGGIWFAGGVEHGRGWGSVGVAFRGWEGWGKGIVWSCRGWQQIKRKEAYVRAS